MYRFRNIGLILFSIILDFNELKAETVEGLSVPRQRARAERCGSIICSQLLST